MKRLYVHMGRAKTGTTALQNFMAGNPDGLAQHRVKYAETGRYYNTHHPLAWSLHREAADRGEGRYWKRALRYACLDRQPQAYWTALKEEMETSAYKTFVVSSEEFGVVLDLHLTAPLLAEFLEGVKVGIIVYFRRQDDFLQSLYNQAVKGNEERFAREFWDYVGPILEVGGADCMKVLSPLSEAFGRENIEVRVYEKEQLRGDIFDDFLAVLRIQDASGFNKPHSAQNPRLRSRLLPIIRNMNRIPMDTDMRSHLLRFLNRRYATEEPFASHELLTPQERCALLKLFRESNQQAAREFLGRSDGRVFYAPEPDPKAKSHDSGLSGEEILEMMTELWKEYASLNSRRTAADAAGNGRVTKQTFHPTRELSTRDTAS
jgi:hypothetical protein